MPAANANGIIRCCRGAQRLLEEKWKRERFEEKRARSAERRPQSAATAAAGAPPPAPDQTDAAAPCNLQDAAGMPSVELVVATANALPSADHADANAEPNTLSASTSNAECEEAP